MTTAAAEQHRATVPPGTRLGRYEVISEIASGGMATVFVARALGAAGFQRLVAIKCLHPHVAKDDEFVAMFMDEARLAARIRHPNVVPTLDLENGADGLFLAMEYVEGDSLLSLLRQSSKAGRKVPAPIALRIILDVLAGLEAAHELTGDRGEPLRLVHRDVSPHNILVGVDGVARITDFGIARAEERISATRDGQVKGKLAYMAPEQTTGESLDRRVDLFAAATVLWEMLAGRRLFSGQTDGEVVRALLVNPIPKLAEAWPDVPPALDAVLTKALDRDRDQRFSHAHALADALGDAAGSIGIASPRAVAQFVRETSSARIDAMQARVRAVLGDSDARLAAAKFGGRRENSDPERTLPVVAAIDLDPNDERATEVRSGRQVIEAAAASLGVAPGGPARVSDRPAVPAPPVSRPPPPTASNPPDSARLSRVSVMPPRKRAAWIAVIIALVAAALVGAFVVVRWSTAHDAPRIGPAVVVHSNASSRSVANDPPTASAPSTTPSPGVPAAVADAAAVSQGTGAPAATPPPVVTAPSVRTSRPRSGTVGGAGTGAAPTAPGHPAQQPFNPESM